MNAPRWTHALLRLLAPRERVDEVLGDLEEEHRGRVRRRGRTLATVLTALETLDVAVALLRQRLGPGSGVSVLDFKLGLRMLVRFPGLTVVGGLAMAFAIWVGALTFEIVRQIVAPGLPLDEGDRIVGVQNVDVEAGRAAAPSLEDFTTWRDELLTIEELGAFRTLSRNLVVDGSTAEPIAVAEMSATGFAVARVPPLLGRTLVASDEDVGAPDVIVIGYEVWQSRFAGDPGVVGRRVGVGRTSATVVGVMPPDFAFPLAHRVWMPLERGPADLQPGEGGRVAVFGRLTAGSGMEEAQAELDVLGARRAAAFPETLGRTRPRVLPYARSVRPLPDVGPVGLLAANLFMVMLLVLVCGNVALLMFARAATREREIAVRSALGASRARIVWQLFAEALVLGGLAALIGLAGAGLGTRWYVEMLKADAGGLIPFWIGDGLAPTTVAYLFGLTLLGAAVAGVAPALKVTGRRVEPRLRQAASGVTGLRLSGVWTPVVVAQVAVTLAFPATAFFFHRYVRQIRSLDLGFAAEEYLGARLEVDEALRAASADPLASVYGELEERLLGEAEVADVTFANLVPGAAHPAALVEVEPVEAGLDREAVHRVAVATVDADFFRVLGRPVEAGRGFDAGDVAGEQGTIVVNRAFEEELLGGRSGIGRRVRLAARGGLDPGPWLEIVGVAENLGMVGGDTELRAEPGFYRPLALRRPPRAGAAPGDAGDSGQTGPVRIVVHVPSGAEAFTSRLRAVAAEVDPDLRLVEVRPLDRVSESRWRESEFLYQLLTGVSLVALILSLTTIYSVMSFTVSRRTREIGLRVALGSSRSRLIHSIFRGPLLRVAVGILVGLGLVLLVTRGLVGPLTSRELILVSLYSATMLGVCLLSCIVPTRRALRVAPAEALSADG